MTTSRPTARDAFHGADAPIFVARRSMGDHRPVRTPVTHQFAALAFYTAGHARMEQRARWTLEPGDVLLVPAGEPHRLVAAEGAEFWGLGFCVPCFAADDAGWLLEPFERVRAGGSAVVRIPAERHAFLEGLFRELDSVSEPHRRGQPHAVQRSLLTLILHEVRRATRWDDDTARSSSVVADSLAYIERNCLGPLTLKQVAQAVGRSPAYVTAALKRATGKSAVEWIIAGRMAEARRLLMHSDEMVDIVAERVGYADATHFIRMFQRAHGATPAAWRAARSTPRAHGRVQGATAHRVSASSASHSAAKRAGAMPSRSSQARK